MFRNAVSSAQEFTAPMIISTRTYNGDVKSGLGSYVVLNDDGWIITSAHALQATIKYQTDKQILVKLTARQNKISNNKNMSAAKKKIAIKKIKFPKDLILNYSIGLFNTRSKLTNISANFPADICIGKINNFNPNAIKGYPYFAATGRILQPGTSLCRLGFPLHKIKSSYDQKNKTFILDPKAMPAPFFPLDGIFTRNLTLSRTDPTTGNVINANYYETSTPGLKEQSGGPLFDVDGTIWGIQSHTNHHDLGFSPEITKNKKKVVEHQFIGVGVATAVDEIRSFLDSNNISYQTR